MADPLSIAASSIAVVTAAIQTGIALNDTVKRFKDRNRTLIRLQEASADLIQVLELLEKATDGSDPMFDLLQSPIKRCNQVCHEFQQSMVDFSRKSRIGILDWAKMEFMRGDMNDFIDTINGYKSTISVGLLAINLWTSKNVSERALEGYIEIIKDTKCDLDLQLQRIDEKMTRISLDRTSNQNGEIDLEDERAVTEQCIRVCEGARSCIDSVANEESRLLGKSPASSAQSSTFEAQTRTRQTLYASRDGIDETLHYLQQRLRDLVSKHGPDTESERQQLQADIDISKQCLAVCNLASEVPREKQYRLGEVIAKGESDQVVVNTVADLFEIKKASATENSAQLLASTTSDGLRMLTENRYASNFGRFERHSGHVELGARNSHPISEVRPRQDSSSTVAGTTESIPDSETSPSQAKCTLPAATETERPDNTDGKSRPGPNEMRKRK